MTPQEERLAALVAARYDGDGAEAADVLAATMRHLSRLQRVAGKVCATCDQHKPFASFGKGTRDADGKHHSCLACEAARKRASRAT